MEADCGLADAWRLGSSVAGRLTDGREKLVGFAEAVVDVGGAVPNR